MPDVCHAVFGAGGIYADKPLFRAGIRPTRVMSGVSPLLHFRRLSLSAVRLNLVDPTPL
ncbi:MAG: hypothetical protein FWC38_06620 [Proteobacteria bacterium]|nr:hypothetical protein [Pseudomonadota bacterium]MCL2307879.1 hypothetical protein [Pseudomonadota bacterium]